MNRGLLLVLIGFTVAALLAQGQSGGQDPTTKDDAKEEAKKEAAEAAFRKQIEASFKALDKDENGYLEPKELPEDLRGQLSKIDRNGDGRVSIFELMDYVRERLQPPPLPLPAPMPLPPRIIIIDEHELEKRPPVFKAGNLPKLMPDWFEKLDENEDGQVALWEWRKGAKTIKEFSLWDRNDDGLVTIEEILFKLERESLAAKRAGKPLAVGDKLEFREMMEDGVPSTYLVKFDKGQTYQVDMITPTPRTLDPFLYIHDSKGKEMARDDDGGGNLNARIRFKTNTGGSFRVIAASVGNRGVGDYKLVVTPYTPKN